MYSRAISVEIWSYQVNMWWRQKHAFQSKISANRLFGYESRKNILIRNSVGLYSLWRNSPTWARAASVSRSHYRTQWHATVARTPLDGESARRIDLYLTAHNIQKRQTPMPPAGFEPAIPTSDRPQILALDLMYAWKYPRLTLQCSGFVDDPTGIFLKEEAIMLTKSGPLNWALIPCSGSCAHEARTIPPCIRRISQVPYYGQLSGGVYRTPTLNLDTIK